MKGQQACDLFVTQAIHFAHSFEAALLAVLQGLLQQVLGGNEDVVVTAGRKAPAANDAFFQLEVAFLPAHAAAFSLIFLRLECSGL